MDELKKYFRFDDTDLEANRNERFSAKQQNDWKAEKFQNIRFGFSMLPIVIILLAVLVYLLRDFNRSVALFCLLYILFFGWLMAGGFWLAVKRYHHHVQKIEGLIRITPHFHPDWDEDGYKHSVLDSYHLRVGDRSFPLNVSAQHVLKCVKQDDTYAVYYDAENPGTILSLEPVSNTN